MRLVITRYGALIPWLLEQGYILPREYRRRIHAGPEHVRDTEVITTHVLPLPLMALAKSVSLIPLAFTVEDKEEPYVTRERIREIACDPVTYVISKCEPISTPEAPQSALPT